MNGLWPPRNTGRKWPAARTTPGNCPRAIYRWIGTGASFGCNPLRAEIGLGGAQRVDRLEVRWPGKRATQTFEGLAVRRAYRITEGSNEIVTTDAGG